MHGGNYDPLTEPQGFTAPTFLVSATGLGPFRGADVQIIAQGLGSDGYSSAPLPASWQAQTGGCAKPRLSITKGSGFASCFLSAWDAVPTLAVGQEGMYYNFSTCITPPGVGVFWLQAAGSAGSNPPLDPSVEYGLYSVDVGQLNTLTSQCPGNSTHGASPVMLFAWYRIPCQDVTRGTVFAALDANNDLDYAPFASGNAAISYNSPNGCFACDRIRGTTWGQLRHMYH